MPTAPLLSTMMCSKVAHAPVPRSISRAMCPLGGMLLQVVGLTLCPGRGAALPGRCQASSGRAAPLAYAINIRAADAIVSNAPKPMKIFPISEVWSQVEVSWLVVAIFRGAGRLFGARRPRPSFLGLPAGSLLSASARSTSLSWSAATTWVSTADWASAEMSARPAERHWPARSSPWRCRTASRRLPTVHWHWRPMAAARRIPAVVGRGIGGFVRGQWISALLLLDLRCATFFQWRAACLAACAALSGFKLVGFEFADFETCDVPSAVAAACEGPAKQNEQSCCKYQCRAPAGFDCHLAISPSCPPPGKETRGVSTARRKKGIFGRVRAKTGAATFRG